MAEALRSARATGAARSSPSLFRSLLQPRAKPALNTLPQHACAIATGAHMMGRRTGTLLIVATILTGAFSIQQPSAQQPNRPDILDGVVGGGSGLEISTAELRRALA